MLGVITDTYVVNLQLAPSGWGEKTPGRLAMCGCNRFFLTFCFFLVKQKERS
jgi:hypothetical protein